MLRPHTGLLEAHRELELIGHIAAAGNLYFVPVT